MTSFMNSPLEAFDFTKKISSFFILPHFAFLQYYIPPKIYPTSYLATPLIHLISPFWILHSFRTTHLPIENQKPPKVKKN